MTDDADRRWSLIDGARSVGLADVGLAGYQAAVVVDPDGDEYLALVCRSGLGDTDVGWDADCQDIRHEQLGPLGMGTKRRIALAQEPHCRRIRESGKACLEPVANPGVDVCNFHQLMDEMDMEDKENDRHTDSDT